MKYGEFRYVHVLMETHNSEIRHIPKDDWHCPIMAEDPREIEDGIPMSCRTIDKLDPAGDYKCNFSNKIVFQSPIPHNPEVKKNYYCICTWPNEVA